MKMSKKANGRTRAAYIGLICVLLFIGLGSVVYLRFFIRGGNAPEESGKRVYKRHYVLICEDGSTGFWNSVLEGAREEGEKKDAYIENFGEDLSVHYSVEQRLEMAIAAKADGIILEGNNSQSMEQLVDQAGQAGIPVVTAMTDTTGEGRISYVGVSAYNLGQKYGNRLFQNPDNRHILVVMNESSGNNMEKSIYSGICETLEGSGSKTYHIENLIVPDESSYVGEELIRNVLLEDRNVPDVMICLDQEMTESACRLLVDLNKVGKVNLMGYYESESIRDAIRRGVLDSTVSVNASQVGEQCVSLLSEYLDTGYVSDYATIDSALLTIDNLDEYETEQGAAEQ
ncbi:MAG: substrate-binding domain-containing protein [Clostridiales bacterium]|nr:substrate-binding domain-containing protein [Clostridiales bacterium]